MAEEEIWKLRKPEDEEPNWKLRQSIKEDVPDLNAIKCRAAVVWKLKASPVIEDVEVAGPKKGEVRIKMISAGVCHSDLHFRDGCDRDWGFPCVLGHEGAGTIESVGEDVTRFKPGDTVLLLFMPFCGFCQSCKDSRTNKCNDTSFKGLQRDGYSRITCKGKKLYQLCSISTFSEYTVTSQYHVTKVNSSANPETLCLAGCCLPTGYGAAMKVAKVTPGSSCAVWGLGGVGMCVIMGCRDSKAGKIIGIDTNKTKFELAMKLGATSCINPDEVKGVREELFKTTDGVDFCFVSVGHIPAMEEAFKSSHHHWGKTVLIGLSNKWEAMQVNIWDVLHGRQLVGTLCGSYKTGEEIPLLVDMVVDGKLQLDELVSHRLPLEDIREGFDMLQNGISLRTIILFDMKEKNKF